MWRAGGSDLLCSNDADSPIRSVRHRLRRPSGWVNYLAVSPGHRGHGHGGAFMAEAERLLVGIGCPKLNLQVRAGNEGVLAFYDALGYEPDHTVSLGKRLIAD
ncbi:hypothetical protein B7R22_02745 [Subtercola boreus]|uniref:N-acetyltransferase domain-containing protein n=1 Tax=Subtercola boreus TaxID=120213 RepID=A0A3E0W2A6_9MICO|nr:hypothetical protein B7R22_02745 [Subtercola boreus]